MDTDRTDHTRPIRIPGPGSATGPATAPAAADGATLASTQHAGDDPGTQRGSRRRRLVVGLAILLALLVLVLAWRPGGGILGAAAPVPTTATGVAEITDEVEDSLDGPDDSGGLPEQPQQPQEQGQGGGGVPLPPVDPPQGPCAGHQDSQGALRALPDPLVLASGVSVGAVTVTNCGAASVDWTAAVNPKVSLATAAGALAPGEATDVGFTVDFDAYGDGAIGFKIKIAEPGHNHYVDVAAYNPLLGSESVAGGGLVAGPGAGGCATQCITKALLRPNATTPNVGLDVATNTPAHLAVFVGKNPPVLGPNGPVFEGVASIDHTDTRVTTWLAKLTPLQADTTYYIIVRAIDEAGNTAFRHGSFRTRTPVTGPGGLAQPGGPAGCAAQCITSAVLTPGTGEQAGTSMRLAVTSHTPALFQASVSRQAPTWSGGVPSFAQTDEWVNSGLQNALTWQTTLTGLEADTAYHIVVKAQDAQGRRSYRAGQFRTGAAPRVTVDFALVSVRVDRDGDRVGRGELSLGWKVGPSTVATFGEKKRSDGELVTFADFPWSYVVPDVAGFLPVVRVVGFERDPDGLVEFCTGGAGVPDDAGRNASCDLKWNVAASGLLSVASVESLPACESFATGDRFPGYRCLEFSSAPDGDDVPSITAVVALRVQ